MDWGPIISAGITGGAGLISGLLGNSIADDQAEEERKAAQDANIQALTLEALKAKYLGGVGGGGGGGGGGVNPNVLTRAQKLSAMQNQGAARADSLNSLISAYQNAMGIR